MKTKIIITLLLLLICASLTFWDLNSTPPIAKEEQIKIFEQRPASPHFSFTTLDGKTRNINDLKGKVILLNFWASWCTPCLAEFPDLIKLAGAHPQDIILLALSVDDDIEKAKTFSTKFDIKDAQNIIIGHDPGKKIAQDLFQTTLYPETYILDKNLKIAHHIAGVPDWHGPEITSTLKTLIEEAPQTQ